MSLSNLPSWDLTQIYKSFDDLQIEADFKKAEELVDRFSQNYRGNVKDLNAAELAQALKLEEQLLIVFTKPSYYFELAYEAGGENVDKIERNAQIAEEKSTRLANKVLFFDLELSRRNDLQELALAAELTEYSYYLSRLAQQAKHLLSEEVEQVLSLKDMSGMNAWAKLYTDMKSKIEVESDIENPGQLKKYRASDLSNLLYGKNRSIRQQAWKLLTDSYGKNEEVVLESYNNILLDKKIEDELRGYQDAEESKLIDNHLNRQVVQNLIHSIENHTDLIQRYYRIKQEILGVDQLEIYDMWGELDLAEVQDREYSWEECQTIILDTFREFSPLFAEIASSSFKNLRIDAADRPRKSGGAFSSGFVKGFEPYILCNYKGRFQDVLTVAHELGHSIHTVLTFEKQNYHNSNYALSMAEIASLCCETLVFDKLIQTVKDPKLRLKLFCMKVEEEAGNIYVGGLGRYKFEAEMHQLYRQEGRISKEQVRQLWLDHHFKNVYGDVFNTTDGAQFTWQSVAHFTYIFYNYVYASGLLISSTVYDVMQQDPTQIENYLEILRSGSYDSPINLLKKMNLDLQDPQFWDRGFRLFEKQIENVEKEWSGLKEVK
ncbi:MAG: M3 family oligoendopeptidase [Patescibacteria group bacterium]